MQPDRPVATPDAPRPAPSASGSPQTVAALQRPYNKYVPPIALLGFAASALEGAGIGFFIPVLTGTWEHLEDSPMQRLLAWGSRATPTQRWLFWGGLLLLLVAAKTLLLVLNAGLMARLRGGIAHDLRQALARRLLHQPYSFYLQTPAARLMDLVTTQAQIAAEAMHLRVRGVSAGAAVLVLVGLQVTLSPPLTAVVALGAALIRLLHIRRNRHLRQKSTQLAQAQRQLTGRTLNLIHGARTIRLFDQQAQEQQHFRAASSHLYAKALGLEQRRAATGPTNELQYAVLFVLVAALAQRLLLETTTLVTFLVLVYRMQPHLIAIQVAYTSRAALQGGIDQVEWLLQTTPPAERAAQTPAPALPLPPPDLGHTALHFKRVCFRYAEPTPALRPPELLDISFTLHPNTTTALLGPSGAGKSTLLLLLTGLLEPTEGEIHFGNHPRTPALAAHIRNQIAVAGQDADLIEGTVASNIAYGLPSASRAEIRAVAALADADDFIMGLPEGYDTPLGHQGQGLSHGQRQRLGLARALLRKPQLLILDEALSAVDSTSEQAIVARLQQQTHHRAALVVSHRPSALALCDQALVLEGGTIVEQAPLQASRYFQAMRRTELQNNDPAGS